MKLAFRAPTLLYPLIGLILTGLIASVLIGLWHHQEQWAIADWRRQMTLLGQARLSLIQHWLDQQRQPLQILAENESLQLYMSELSTSGGNNAATDEALTTYLRQLLAASAQTGGYASPIQENVSSDHFHGLFLLNNQGAILAASSNASLPPLQLGKETTTDFYLEKDMLLQIHAVPVQTDTNLGWIAGIRPAEDSLRQLLKERDDEMGHFFLLRQRDGKILYILPPEPGLTPLQFEQPNGEPELDAAYAFQQPGMFAEKRDYRGRRVFALGMKVPTTDWVLLYTLPVSDALAMVRADARRLLLVVALAMVGMIAIITASWRHFASRRAEEMLGRTEKLASLLKTQKDLLQAIMDHNPGTVFILDKQGRYVFANRHVSDPLGLKPEDFPGKNIAAVLGPDRATFYLKLCEAASRDGETLSRMRKSEEVHLLTRFVPLPSDGSVLVVEEDVSQVTRAQEKQSRTMHLLIESLINAIDQRDPYAAHHSTRVASLSRAIASEMGLNDADTTTAAFAGQLFNLGKLLVAPEILAKKGSLTDSEQEKLHLAIRQGTNLLRRVEFDGPVFDVINEALNRKKETEPLTPMAEAVLLANSFVGMISERAHRPAYDIDSALDLLLKNGQHDRRAIAALISYLDNHGGRDHYLAKEVN